MEKKISATERRIASICEGEPAIAAVYLFGSSAQGKAKKSSDIDIALLLNENKMAGFSVLDFITVLKKKSDAKPMSLF